MIRDDDDDDDDDETVQTIKVGPVQGCQDQEDKRPNVGGPLLLISGGATSVNA